MALRFAQVAVCLTLLLVAGLTPATSEYYRWVDDKGVTHFSDSYYDVPPEYRDPLDEVRGDFDEQAPFSVIDGLDRRVVPEQAFPRGDPMPSKGGTMAQLESLKNMQMRPPGLADLKQMPVLTLIGMVAWVLFCMLVMLSISAFFLITACRIAGEEEPPRFLKAVGVVVIQSVACTLSQLTLQVAIIGNPTIAGTLTPQKLMAFMGLNMLVSSMVWVGVLRAMVVETVLRGIAVMILVFLLAIVAGVVLLAAGLLLSCVGAALG